MSEVLCDRYILQKELGSGPHGITFLAHDQQTDSAVSLKRLRHQLDSSARDVWLREVSGLRSLNHEKIPSFIDFFEVEVNGRVLPHLVQGFVQGKSLQQTIEAGRVSIDKALGIVIDLIDVLCYLQAKFPPILHRNIKPKNIIFHKQRQQYLLTDFGTSTSLKGHTFDLRAMGYQPLEQVEGSPNLSSDLYSVGVIAVQLITGKTIDSLYHEAGSIRWRDAVTTVNVAENVLLFLEKMLAKNSEERFSNALEAFKQAKKCLAIVTSKKVENFEKKMPKTESGLTTDINDLIDSTDIFFNDPSDEVVLPHSKVTGHSGDDEDEISGIFQKVISEPSSPPVVNELENKTSLQTIALFIAFLIILVAIWVVLL